MVTDKILQSLNVNDVVFYNGSIYRIVSILKDQKRISLQYATGSQLATPKAKYASECLKIPENTFNWYLLQKG